ncbi:MAG: hypothetical protein AAGB19_13175 [Cyanobacteria bacterium P01_F01_bin.3]
MANLAIPGSSGESYRNTDYAEAFQDSPTACVPCYLLGTADVRERSAHSIGFPGSERVCEVCQQRMYLPYLQSAPTEKESSMQSLPNVQSDANGQPLMVERPVNRTTVYSKRDNQSYVSQLPGSNMPSLQANLQAYDYAQTFERSFEPVSKEVPQFRPQQFKRHQQQTQKRRRTGRAAAPESRFLRIPLPGKARRATPEPAMMASTYVVPKRSRSSLLDQLTSSIPFTVLMVVFGISLAAAVALASPTTAVWLSMSNLIINLLRALFVTIAFSLAISFVAELGQ